MMKYYLLIFAFIFSFSCFSQSVVIALQNFDETTPEWSYTTDIIFFDNSTDGFFGIHDGDSDGDSNDTGFASQATAITSSVIENDFLFIHDLHDEFENGTNQEAFITFENIDVSSFFDIQITFDYEVFEFENSDYIVYEVIEDGITSQAETLIKNGVGSVSFFIKNSTTNLSLRLIINQNGEADYAAIDNIKLEGKPIIPCNDLFISEYVEGTSSTNHRNNFIEIYNPTSNSINLENYDLVTFTNESVSVSNTLTLTGTIAAFGVFLIEDTTENLGISANLSSSSAVMNFNGNDKIALVNSSTIIDLIGIIGDSNDFAKDITLRRKSNIQSPNTQYNSSEWDMYELENIKNIHQHVSICSGPIPEIEVTGNFNNISDEASATSFSNNTYFGAINVETGESISKSFTIKNNGNADLNISGVEIIGSNPSYFSLENAIIATIIPTDSIQFTISFEAISQGIKSAIIKITNTDNSENPFQFLIQGEGTGNSNSPLLISQYYEGDGNNKWLEITNISNNATPNDMYYLALYRNDNAKNPIGLNPSIQKAIPTMQPGEVLKYTSTLSTSKPEYALDGTEIKTQICQFSGDDIVLISTSNDINCWENKIDIIGNSSNWGENKSFIRKYGCEESLPKTGFTISDWLIFETEEVDIAVTGYNIVLGEHYTGSTTFENNNIWNNGFPDIYREVSIDSDYNTNFFTNFQSCNLTINTGKIVTIEPDDYITIQSELTVNGVLNVLHEGSLLMIDNDGLVLNNGEINIHKTSTTLKKYDYTYWSSPVTSAILETVFNASPQNSFYNFNTSNYIDSNNDNEDDDENAWQRVTGEMVVGVGYTAMAPNTTPFINSQSIVFTGEINNGTIEVPVNLSADNANTSDDWNLIGNPYPSAIDANLLLNHPANLNTLGGSVYFWTHNTSPDGTIYSSDDYAVYTVGTGGIAAVSQGQTPTGTIASGQGFFVEGIQQGSIIFNNEMRTNIGNTNFFKTNRSKEEKVKENDKLWLNLYNNKGAFSQILIGFIPGASEVVEQKYDGKRLDGNSFVSFYSIINNENLAIQGTKSWSGNEVVPLGFSSKIKEKVALAIGIDHLEGNMKNQDIYLHDKHLNIIHNLKLEDYSFQTETEGHYNDRFALQFNASILTIENLETTKEELLIKNDIHNISVRTNKNSIINDIKIYDVLGRKFKDQTINSSEFIITKNIFNQKGIYIIQVKLENSMVLVKKFIP